MIIKARAWDKSRGKMYSPEQLGKDEMQLQPDGRGFFNASPTSPKLSQYFPHLIPLPWTNLQDKDGAEIYKGDIFEFADGERMPVEWDDFEAGWALVRKDENEKVTDRYTLGYYARKGKVIGNVFENPDLVKPCPANQ